MGRGAAPVYGGDIEKLDLMPGMYAERLPKGFAFNRTAFRLFLAARVMRELGSKSKGTK